MILGDRIRLPSAVDLDAPAYKDWLHLILFGPDQAVVLVNISLHGDPRHRSSLAVATVLVHDARGWWQTMEILKATDAVLGRDGISVGDVAKVHLEADTVRVRAHTPHVSIDATAQPLTLPLVVEDPIPFGTGWIAWRVSPRMAVEGHVIVLGDRWTGSRLTAYHDHNWGRWHWGDDIGWEWATLMGDDLTLVMAGVGGRDHRRLRHRLWGWIRGRPVSFDPRSVSVTHRGRQQGPLLRIPGAMAALHAERRDPFLPKESTIAASDGFDSVLVTSNSSESCQIITADPVSGGSGFIHEMAGTFEFSADLGRVPVRGGGVAISERVS